MDAPTLVIATHNPGKVRELQLLLKKLGINLMSLQNFPDLPEIIEDGPTFAANAQKKARAVARATGFPALADDSGLEVAALGGRPGVHSARYAADRTYPDPPTDQDNYLKLLEELADIPWDQRQAQFVCEMVLAFPDSQMVSTQGTCKGMIALKPQGQQGFGYDPVFWLPQYGCTMAEIDLDLKNQISHRAQALKEMKSIIAARLQPMLKHKAST
ncbi:MAG: XTP/dITP diphosphatase [Deltaproteobacteria bacterium]|nr:XTP/dITP diphosphatase [Deltaproteobacteria bacterium]MBW1951574.1 XTP/dITP diphosphatase [Deltaproteobacteria bacterium]MBW1986591.1 XTP/dITP diphosphatase [Deltaproteobacteria bacterium]MBW2134809.1 XTP/dITP diphosphatase [Deltaproteobacteria bacterium]